MSDQTPPRSRQLPSRIDSKTGNYRFTHNLTPSSQTDTVQLRLPARQQGLALYPLRYAILRHAFAAQRFPTLDVSAYADLGEGFYRGVRELRPRTQLYLFYTLDGAFQYKHYQVTDEVQFAQVQAEIPEPAQQLDEDGVPLREYPAVSAAHAYITVPVSGPAGKVGDTIYLLNCDTELTTSVLGRLERDEQGLLTQTATAIRLGSGHRQPHAMPIEALGQIPALQDDEQQRLAALEWSESQPEGLLGGNLLARLITRGQAPSGSLPLVVALHDPVGVMSEMGHFTGSHVLELQAWSQRGDVPRKVMVSQWIDQLGQQKARTVELDSYRNDSTGSAIPAGVGGGAANAARDRAYRAGLAASAERLSYARNDERRQFMASYEQQRQVFLDAIDRSAALACAMFTAIRPLHDKVMQLYDETDAENFICLRRVVTHSLSVLACDPRGRQVLEGMLPESGPTGLMERALLGFPAFAQAINAGTAQQAGMVLAGLGADKVRELLAKVPADDSSRYLGGVVAQLVLKGRLRSPEAFERSLYFRALQLLDNTLIEREAVPLGEAGKWLLEKNGGQPVHGFRPVTLARQANELIYLYKSEPVQIALKEQRDDWLTRVNFWHGLKFGIGVLGVYLGTRNLLVVVEQLGKEDGEVLVNSLNLASGMLSTGSGVVVLGETSYQWRSGLAAAQAQTEMGKSLKRTADRYGNWAVGLLALSAAIVSVREIFNAYYASTSRSAAAHTTASVLQASAATLGGLHLLGRLDSQNSKWGKGTLASAQRFSMGRTGVLASGTRAALALTRLGAGPVGWTLLGLEVATQAVLVWNERNAREEKVTDWIARSIWGTGVRRGWFGDSHLEPFSSLEEVTEFYRFFLEPHIETDVAVLRSLGSLAVPLWGSINQAQHGSRLPQDARTVTIALPGWQPQVSRYEVVQYKEFGFSGVQQTLSNPEEVTLRDGVGYVSYPTDTLGGDIRVRYWPNTFAEPDIELGLTKT